MAEEIVRVIKVDTKNSGKSINDLRKDIKALRQELEKTEVGSEEFSAALKQLTQTQKEYNTIQQQVRDMSRTNQQDMVKFASFARNLGKSYSALNAAVGLFADKNEDVQKSMLKVQRTIQLIQGLDGLSGLVRDLPKVIAGFKSWIQALSPLERSIDKIAKGIDGIDPATLKQLNELNRGGGAGGGSASSTAGGGMQYLPAQNEELKKATTTYYPALLKQEKDLLKVRKQLESDLKGYNKTLENVAATEKDIIQALLTGYTKTGHSIQDVQNLMQKYSGKSSQLIMDLASMPDVADAANKELTKMGYTLNDLFGQNLSAMYANASKSAEETTKNIAEVNKQLEIVQKEIATQEAGMTKFQKTLARTGVVGKAAIGMIKTALYSIGIGLLIAGLSKAVEWLIEIWNKSKEIQKLNKEISQSTNSAASKQIVVLKELSIAYQKLGDSAEKKQEFIQKYSDKIKEAGVSITDLKSAEDVLVNNTDKYVDAIMKRAKAQAIENAAVKIYQDYLDERYDLEKKFEDNKNKAAGTNSKEEYITLLKGMGMTAEEAEQAWSTATNKRQQKILADIDAADKKVQERLKRMFEDVAELEKEYAGFFSSSTVTTTAGGSATDWAKQYADSLESLKDYVQDALDVFKDARTKELDDNKRAYDKNVKDINESFLKGVEAAKGNAEKLLAIEDEKNKALELTRLAFERRMQEIIQKYNDQALEDEKKRIEDQYEVIQKEIERIRKMSDTSYLRSPQQQVFQTVYKGNGVMPFGIQKNWVNVYQSKEDVENQYKAQIEYNNKVYELTKQRIEQENALLQKQLEIEGLDADKRLEIQRTLAENEIALSDAKIENEQANLDAYLEVQEKKKQALEGVLDVASTTLGAMSSIFKTEAQIHQTESQDLNKSQKEREEAAKKMEEAMIAYKAFAITQAIVDTWKSANEAYAAMASIPYVGPALGIAASAAAVISGMANVRAIMSESMSSSSQSASVTAPSAMTAPPIEYTRNLVGDKELDEINQPIRCYVLESDISKTQNKVKVTEQNATF